MDDLSQWKREQSRQLWSRIIRWGLGVPLALSFPWLGPISPFLALLGVIMIAPDVASYIGGISSRILFPSYRGERKPLRSIAESLVAKGQYAEAEEEYEKIIGEFPNDAESHIGLINIAVMRMNDAELAENLYQRGMSLLKKEAARETLTQAYARIRTRIRPHEEEGSRNISAKKLDEVRAKIERRRDWK